MATLSHSVCLHSHHIKLIWRQPIFCVTKKGNVIQPINFNTYSGTSVKQLPRGVVFFGCLREMAAQRRYSLTGKFEKSGELI